MAGNGELGDSRQEPLPLSTVLGGDRPHALITISECERKLGNKKTVDILLIGARLRVSDSIHCVTF